MEHLISDVNNGVATITLNRPESRNAFSLEMIEKWIAALEEIRDNEEIRVGVLTGNGKGFCSGGDIKSMLKGEGFVHKGDHEADIVSNSLNRKHALWKYIHRIPLLMQEIDKPMIAKMNGDAMGAGLDMALMCDLRYISREARVGETYIRAGLVPGDGGTYYLPRLIRMDKALELFWTGKIIDATEAEEIGIVTKVVEPDELNDYVDRLTTSLCHAPQQSLRLIKRAVYQSENLDLRTTLDMISSHMGVVTDTEDYMEGIKAMSEKENRTSTDI